MTRFKLQHSGGVQTVIWAQPDVDTEDDVIVVNGDQLDTDSLPQKQDIVGRVSAISRQGRRREFADGTILYKRRRSAAARLLSSTASAGHRRSPLIIALLCDGNGSSVDGSRPDTALIEGLIRDAPRVAADLGRSLDGRVAEWAVRRLVRATRSRWRVFAARIIRRIRH
jgi:hypothetical protein